MQSTFVLNIDEVEVIKRETTSREQAEKLIDVLLNKKRNYFTQFHNALEYAEYLHLAELLKGALREEDVYNSSDEDDDSEHGELPDSKNLEKADNLSLIPDKFSLIS